MRILIILLLLTGWTLNIKMDLLSEHEILRPVISQFLKDIDR